MAMGSHSLTHEMLEVQACLCDQTSSISSLTNCISRLRRLTLTAAPQDLAESLEGLASTGVPDALAASVRVLQDPLLAYSACGLLRSWAVAASTIPSQQPPSVLDRYHAFLAKAATSLRAVASTHATEHTSSYATIACLIQGMSGLIGVPTSLHDKLTDEAISHKAQQQQGEESTAAGSQRSSLQPNASYNRTAYARPPGRTGRRFSTRARRASAVWDIPSLHPTALQAACTAGLWELALTQIQQLITTHPVVQQGSNTWGNTTDTGSQLLSYVCEMLAVVSQAHYEQQLDVQDVLQSAYDMVAQAMCATLARLLQQSAGIEVAVEQLAGAAVAPGSSPFEVHDAALRASHQADSRKDYQWLCAWAAELSTVMNSLTKLIVQESRWGCAATAITTRAVNSTQLWPLLSHLVGAMAGNHLTRVMQSTDGNSHSDLPHESAAHRLLAMQLGITGALEPLLKLGHDLSSACSSCPEGSDLHRGLQGAMEQLADALIPHVFSPWPGAGAAGGQTATSLHTWLWLLADLMTACSEDWLREFVLKCGKHIHAMVPLMQQSAPAQQPDSSGVVQHPSSGLTSPFASMTCPDSSLSGVASGLSLPSPSTPYAPVHCSPEAAAASVSMCVYCLWTLDRKGTLDYVLDSQQSVAHLLQSAAQLATPGKSGTSKSQSTRHVVASGWFAGDGGDGGGAADLTAYGTSVDVGPHEGLMGLMAGMKRLQNRRLPTVISAMPTPEHDDNLSEENQGGPTSATDTDTSDSPDDASATDQDGLMQSAITTARGCLHAVIQVLSKVQAESSGDEDVIAAMHQELACACAALAAECLWEVSGGPPEKGMVAGLMMERHGSGVSAAAVGGTAAEGWPGIRSKASLSCLGPNSIPSRQDSHVSQYRSSLLRHLNSSRRSQASSVNLAQLPAVSAFQLSRPPSMRKQSGPLSGLFNGPSSVLKAQRTYEALFGTSAPGRPGFARHGSRSSLSRQTTDQLLRLSLEDNQLLVLGGEQLGAAASGEVDPLSRLARAPAMRLERDSSLRAASEGEHEAVGPVSRSRIRAVGPRSGLNKRAPRRKSTCDLPTRRTSYYHADLNDPNRSLHAVNSAASMHVPAPVLQTDSHILDYLTVVLPLLGSWVPGIDTTLKLCEYLSLVAVELGLLQQHAARDSRGLSSQIASHMRNLERLLVLVGSTLVRMMRTSGTLDKHQKQAGMPMPQPQLRPHEKRFSCLYQSAGRSLAVLQELSGVDLDSSPGDVVEPALSSLAASGALAQMLQLSCSPVLLEDAAFQTQAGLQGWVALALLHLPSTSRVQVVGTCTGCAAAACQAYSKCWRHPKGHVLGRLLLQLQADSCEVRAALQQENLTTALCSQLQQLLQWPRELHMRAVTRLGSQPLAQHTRIVHFSSQEVVVSGRAGLGLGPHNADPAGGGGGGGGVMAHDASNHMASSVMDYEPRTAGMSPHKALLPLCLAFSLAVGGQVTDQTAAAPAQPDNLALALALATEMLPGCMSSAAQQLSRADSSTVTALCDITGSGVMWSEEGGGYRVGIDTSTWLPVPHLVSVAKAVVDYLHGCCQWLLQADTHTAPHLPLSVSEVVEAGNRLASSMEALLQVQPLAAAASGVSVNDSQQDDQVPGLSAVRVADALLAALAQYHN